MRSNPVWLGDCHQGPKVSGFTLKHLRGQGNKGIAGLPPESYCPSRGVSDGAGGTLRGPPA
jgi:hypothetical protein